MKQSEIIKLTRKKAGLSQKQLAQATGLSVATIQGYEQEKYYPKIESLIKLAAVLNVSIEDLAGDDSINIYRSDINEIPNKIEIGLKQSLQKTCKNTNEILSNFVKHAHNALNSDYRSTFLLNDFEKLNNTGRNVALERIKELTEIERYIAPDDPAPADQPDQHPDQD